MGSSKSPLEFYHHKFKVRSNSVAVGFSVARCGVVRDLKLITSIVMPGENNKDKKQRVESMGKDGYNDWS